MPADKPRRLSRVRSRTEARRPPATLSPARTGRRCAPKRSEDPRSGATCRPHYLDSMVQRAVARGGDAAGTEKRAMCHTLRPERSEEVVLDCGTRLPRTWLQDGTDVGTTMQYVHVLEQTGAGVTSPLDTLPADST